MIEPFFPASSVEPISTESPETPAADQADHADAAAVAAPTAVQHDPGARPAPSNRRGGGIRMVLAASMLSAALASGATAALTPRGSGTNATATTAAATSTAAGGGVITAAASTSSSVAAVVATDSPAVVTIESTITAQVGGRGGAASATGVGSGFIYAADGYILTAAHVVEGASQITVTLADGRTFPGTVAASDVSLDVAVVKIAATGLPTVTIGTSSALKVGQTVMAIGDPLGQYPGSVTIGIVSGLDRAVTVGDEVTSQARDLTGLVQTDAAINQGNSGGPLIDASGAVVGLITAGSTSAEGIAFAVPIDAASGVITKARTV